MDPKPGPHSRLGRLRSFPLPAPRLNAPVLSNACAARLSGEASHASTTSRRLKTYRCRTTPQPAQPHFAVRGCCQAICSLETIARSFVYIPDLFPELLSIMVN